MNKPLGRLSLPVRVFRTWMIVTFFFLAASALPGQNYPDTRSVRGTVTYSDKEPVAGAVVQLENTRTLGIRSYITNREGRYQFQQLDGDIDYRLQVEYRGRFGKPKILSRLNSSKVAEVDLEIPSAK
jgi:hypothetical protein